MVSRRSVWGCKPPWGLREPHLRPSLPSACPVSPSSALQPLPFNRCSLDTFFSKSMEMFPPPCLIPQASWGGLERLLSESQG